MKLLNKIKLAYHLFTKSIDLTDSASFKTTFAEFLNNFDKSRNTGYVGSCANIWGLSFARAVFRVYDRESDDAEWLNHPAVELLKNPFPYFTGWELMHRISSDLIFEGNCYILKLRPKVSLLSSSVSGLYPLQASRITTYPYNVQRIEYYEYNTGSGITRFELDDIIHLKSPDRSSVIKGAPIILRIADVEEVERMQIEYRRLFYQKGGFLGATFTTDQNMSPDAFSRALDMLQTKYGGNQNAFKAALFDNNLKPVATAYSLKDMQMKEERELNRDEICAAFGVNKLLFGLSDNIQRGNADTVHYVFYSTHIDPLLDYIDQALTNQLLSVDFRSNDGSASLYFMHDKLAQRDTEQELKYYENGLKYGWLSPDEVRQEEGFPALGGEYSLPNFNNKPQAQPAN